MIKLSDDLHIPSMGEVIRDRTASEQEAAKQRAKRVKQQRRSYKGANLNRLNSDWTVTPTSANYELRTSLRALRGRARQLSRDNSFFKKFLSMAQANVIGPRGVKLQVGAKMPDGSLNAELNKKVEDAFADWGHKETCSISGKLNWVAAQRLFVRHLARDGEVLVQKVTPNSGYGFALKFWDVSYLDEMYNETSRNGNRIIMSVEIDDNNKPVAYWLTTPPSDIMFAKRMERTRTRIPADQMIHAFMVNDDESQVRGVTWFHSAMLDGKNLQEYDEGVITSARMTANAGGFIRRAESDEYELAGEEDDDGEEKDIELEMAPASFLKLPDGYEFQQFDPKQPTQNHAEYKKTVVMGVAIGLDVFYFSLSGNMEAVNFSSARLGLGEEHDMWRMVQDFVATNFCREVYHSWISAAVLSGALRLNQREFAQVQNPSWRPRGWQYFDPMKEINANVTGLANNMLSLRDVIEEQGGDLEEHFQKIKAERELAMEYGIDLTYVTKTTATEPGPTDPNAADGPNAEKPKPADKKKGENSFNFADDVIYTNGNGHG
jgi:lambda family phage portal protein